MLLTHFLACLQCATISKNTKEIADDGGKSGIHSTSVLFYEAVPEAADTLSGEEKLANAVSRLEAALEN